MVSSIFLHTSTSWTKVVTFVRLVWFSSIDEIYLCYCHMTTSQVQCCCWFILNSALKGVVYVDQLEWTMKTFMEIFDVIKCPRDLKNHKFFWRLFTLFLTSEHSKASKHLNLNQQWMDQMCIVSSTKQASRRLMTEVHDLNDDIQANYQR